MSRAAQRGVGLSLTPRCAEAVHLNARKRAAVDGKKPALNGQKNFVLNH